MNRPLAFICALLFAFVSVSSACMAQPSDPVRFTLEPQRSSPGKIRASFRNENRGRDDDNNNWSTGFMPSDLIGLEVSSFHGAGTRPLHFAIVREAGRLDCAGNGGNDYATGNCRSLPIRPSLRHWSVAESLARRRTSRSPHGRQCSARGYRCRGRCPLPTLPSTI